MTSTGGSDNGCDPIPVVRLEWRKIRREESRGLTSHSWLEAYLPDKRRLKFETYSDTGYTESLKGSSEAVEGTIYAGRVAECEDFACQLTAERLQQIAKDLGGRQPYSLSEYNCHHFVLDVWNKVTVDRMRATHFPDRAKLGILWGLEGTVGTWMERFQSQSLGAPQERVEKSARSKRLYVATQCDASDYNAAIRLRFFKDALENGLVYVVEPTSQDLRPTECPLPSMDMDIIEAWSSINLDGLGLPARKLCERIGPIELSGVVAQLDQARTPASGSNNSLFSFLSSFASISSASTSLSSQAVQAKTYHPHDICFVVLRSQELRLVVYGVLQSTANPNRGTCLRLLSGNAFAAEEAVFAFSHCDLPDGSQTQAIDLASEELPNLQLACRTGDYETFLGGWRKIGNRKHVV